MKVVVSHKKEETQMPVNDPIKKLDTILRSHEGWRSRVGVQNRLVASLHEFLEGAFMSGYMQALIDHGLPTGDLAAEIEQRNVTEGR